MLLVVFTAYAFHATVRMLAEARRHTDTRRELRLAVEEVVAEARLTRTLPQSTERPDGTAITVSSAPAPPPWEGFASVTLEAQRDVLGGQARRYRCVVYLPDPVQP